MKSLQKNLQDALISWALRVILFSLLLGGKPWIFPHSRSGTYGFFSRETISKAALPLETKVDSSFPLR